MLTLVILLAIVLALGVMGLGKAKYTENKLNLQLFASGNINTIGNGGAGYVELANEDAEIYEKEMFDRLIPELYWFKWGKKKRLPKKSGSTVSVRRFENLAVATTAITEGVIPAGADLVVVKRTATVEQYGNYVRTTEFLNLVGLDDTVVELSQLLGENAGQSIDIIVRDVVLAGTNVYYANGVASRVLVATNITYNDILRLARTMKVNKVKKISMGEGGRMGYVMAVDPYVAYDVKQLTEYKEYNKYENSDDLRMGVIAVLGGMMFVEVDNGSVASGEGAGGEDVHLSCVLGKDGYMVPDIDGKSKPEIIVKPAGSAGSNDPLNQIASVGWKATFTTMRVEELAILRYESLATDA